MRNRHNARFNAARSIANPCPIDAKSNIYQPHCVGTLELESFNYLQLPKDDPKRIHIEQLVANVGPYRKDVFTTAPQHRKNLERSKK